MKKGKEEERIGILGYGEVGQAMAKFYKSPKIKDLDRDDGLKDIEILHVCIPYSEKFISIIKKEIKKIKPKLTIIHSTVAVGTTKKLGGRIVHSPVRGLHPNLHQAIKTFVKYIGADDEKIALMAQKHLEGLGIKTKILMPSTTTELGKLLDTTYYGLCIAFHGEVKKMCDQLKLDFEKVATDFNQTYNEGYKKLGLENVIRPVLHAPNPSIGGHCIIQNAKILKKYFPNPILDLILKYQPKKK